MRYEYRTTQAYEQRDVFGQEYPAYPDPKVPEDGDWRLVGTTFAFEMHTGKPYNMKLVWTWERVKPEEERHEAKRATKRWGGGSKGSEGD
jgi:hypothetical protein